MYNKLSSLLTLFAVPLLASAANNVNLCGVDYSVDTLFHAKVGPGTNQTSLRLQEVEGPGILRVFYSTIDLNNPIVTFESTKGSDMVAGGATIPDQAAMHNTEEKKFFSGINTDFGMVTGTASNGVSQICSPVHSMVNNGQIFRTHTTCTEAWPSLFFDESGLPTVAPVDFSKGEVICDDKKIALTVINHIMAERGVALFTPLYYGTMDQGWNANACAEVTLRKLEGDIVSPGKSLTFEVVSGVSHTGDKNYSGDEYVIAGKGDGKTFIEGLKIGDILKVTPRAFANGKEIFPIHLCTGNPHILKEGITLHTEGDREDASSRHPRSSIGYNADKSKFIMMVVDGRSSASNGVYTMELADIMRYAGATDAMNVDGGGSSTLYLDKLGVRNVPSDGHPRVVPCGLFAVAKAPEDNNVAEIRFVDWAMEFPKYGIYTPKFYGYNKYGMLIDTDVQGVTLSCDAKIGEVINDGATFYGTGDGCAALTANYNGLSASIPVTVAESDKVNFRLSNVLIDNVREYPIEVNSVVGEKEMPISPTALSWSSDNSDIASISADGLLKGISDGVAVVSGKVGNFVGNLNVKVEVPTGESMPVYRDFPTDATIKQVGGTGIKISEFEKGFKLNYTGKSGRGQYIEISKTYPIWSLPEKLRIRINPGDAKISKITATAKNAFGVIESVWTATESSVPNNEETEYYFNVKDWCDPTDIAVYPITLEKLRFAMSGSVAGKAYEISVPKFEAIYSQQQGGIVENTVSSGLKVYSSNGEIVVVADSETVIYVSSIDGRCATYKVPSGETRLSGFSNGVYIVNGMKIILLR